MNNYYPIPCPEWEDRLAATQLDDFTPEDRQALEAHTRECSPCKTLLDEYYAMDRRVRLGFHHNADLRKLANEKITQILQESQPGITIKLPSRRTLAVLGLFISSLLLLWWVITFVGYDFGRAIITALAYLETLLLVFILLRPDKQFFVPAFSFATHAPPGITDIPEHMPSHSQEIRKITVNTPLAHPSKQKLIIGIVSLMAAIMVAGMLIMIQHPFYNPPIPSTIQADDPIGISIDGSLALDTNRQNGQIKIEAAQQVLAGDTTKANSLWQKALEVESNDAEAGIYLENQHVLASGRPYVTIVLGVILNRQHIGGGRDLLQGAYIQQKMHNTQTTDLLLRFIIASTSTDPQSPLQIAQQVVDLAKQDKTIVGVMGWASSGTTLRALSLFEAANLPLISATASSDELTGKSPNFFRIAPADSQQGKIGATYARDTLNAHKVTLFVDESEAYSKSLANAFENNFTDPNHYVSRAHYTKDNPETIQPALEAALKDSPDLIYFAGYVSDASVLLKHLPTCKLNDCLLVLGGDALYVEGNYSLEAFNNYNRLRFTAFAFHEQWQDAGLANPPFFANYALTFDPHSLYHPNTYGYNLADADAILGYDAIGVLAQAVENIHQSNGELTPAKVTSALKQIHGDHAYQGVSGQIAFDEQGNVLNKAIVVLAGNNDQDTTLVSIHGRLQK